MPVVKPLAESLQKELAKEQEQAALKHQLRAYRKWFSALDRNPPQREVVPGYASGGRVWSPGYAATQLSSPAYQQYTPQELEYIRLLEEKNRQAGAGTAFDVIPGNVVEPTMRVGYTPQEQEYIRLLAEKDKPKQELVQLLEPQDVRTRQEIIFRGETPEQVAERNAETILGAYDSEEEAIADVRKERRKLDAVGGGGRLEVYEDGSLIAKDSEGRRILTAEEWDSTGRPPNTQNFRILPRGDSRIEGGFRRPRRTARMPSAKIPTFDEFLEALVREPIAQGIYWENPFTPEEIEELRRYYKAITARRADHGGTFVMAPGYAEGGRVWSPGYAANRLSSPAYDDEEEQRRRNGGYTDQELAYIRLLEQKQGGGAFDVIPGTGYQAQPTMRVGYTPKELEYIRLLEEKEKEPEQWRPGYAADKLEESVEATAARLNPAASAYEAGRQVEPGLRPSNVDKNPFASLNVFERQEEIFRGMEPGTRAARALGRLEEEERQALLILAQELEKDQYTTADLERFFQQRGNTDYLESNEPIARTLRRARETMQLLAEKKAEVAAGKDPGEAIREIEATLQERETGGVRPLEFSPLRTELPGELFSPLPDAIEGPARMTAEGVLSPLGLASGATFGAGQLLRGSAASVGAGAATAPLGPIPQQAAMIAADVLAGGPSRAPGRLADDVPAIRDDIIPEAGMQPGARTPRTVRVGGLEMSIQDGRPDFNQIMVDIERVEGQPSIAELRQAEQEIVRLVDANPGVEIRSFTQSDLADVLVRRGAREVEPGGAEGTMLDLAPLGRRTMGAEPPTPTALREPDLLPPSAASASPSPAQAERQAATAARQNGQVGDPQIRIRDAVDAEDVATAAAEEDAIARSMDDILNEARRVCDTM